MQVLLRGCMLRNTPHIFGVVIFTGHQTKVPCMPLSLLILASTLCWRHHASIVFLAGVHIM